MPKGLEGMGDAHHHPEHRASRDAQGARARAKRVAEGAFSNASDLVPALIRRDKEQQEKLAALRRNLAVGIDQLDQGEGLDGERVFAELLAEGPQR